MSDFKNYGNSTENKSGRVMGGIFIVLVGLALLLNKMELVFLPYWLFKWEMFLIGIGLYVGFRNNFKNPSWIFLVAIGSIFLLDDIVADFSLRRYFWPILIIMGGLWLIFSSNIKKNWAHKTGISDGDFNSDDVLDSVAVFGGVKKNIISKDFKGGEVVTILGGSEINLGQADINGRVELEIVSIFGGTRLVVPSHWEIKSELAAVLGGIDDKRSIRTDVSTSEKVLVLKGTAVLGGIDIRTY